MSSILFAAVSVVVAIALIYSGVNLLGFTAWIGAVALGFYALGDLSQSGLMVFAAIYVPLAVLLNVPAIRRAIISGPIFTAFRKALPNMSQTERDALEAGDTWWEGEMFRGKPDWSKLTEVKFTELTAEEQSSSTTRRNSCATCSTTGRFLLN